MISLAFQQILDKLEAEEKGDEGRDTAMRLPERKEDMVTKELNHHCNSLCFTLFMGVKDVIGEELKAIVLEAALDSLVEERV
jgi:hypothetical protein